MLYELGGRMSERGIVALAIAVHHALTGCGCMRALWPRFRAGRMPADLDLVRSRIGGAWDRIEAERRTLP
jgi:hypothetical protein